MNKRIIFSDKSDSLLQSYFRDISKYKILDNEEINKLIVEAQNGEEAVAITKNRSFELILMDIQIPIMNGYEAAQAIRSSNKEDAKTIPIIAVTADAFVSDVSKALSVGMNEHIAKPIDSTELYSILAKFLL